MYKKLNRKANRIRKKIHNVLLEISDLLSQVIVKSLRSLWTEPFQSRVPGFKKVSRKIAVQVQLLAQKCARVEEHTQSFFALTLIRCQCVQTTIRYSNSTTVNSYQGTVPSQNDDYLNPLFKSDDSKDRNVRMANTRCLL